MTEDLLRETLRDPDRALPTWRDPVARIRRVARERRRRQFAVAGATAAVVAGAALLPGLLPGDGARQGQPAAPGPAAVAVARQAEAVDLGGPVAEVAAGERAWALVGDRLLSRPMRQDESVGTVTRVGDVTHLTASGGSVWFAGGARLWHFLGEGDPVPAHTFPARIDDVVAEGDTVWVAAGDRVHRIPARGAATDVRIGGTGRIRLAVADGALWARRADGDGALLVRLDPERLVVNGTARIDGGPRDAPFVAGGGRVHVATAYVGDDYLTKGAMVTVDATTLEVSEPRPAPYPRDLAYDRDGVWLLGFDGALHRLDPVTLEPRGTEVQLGRVRGIAVSGARILVAGDLLLRYESLSRTARPYDLLVHCGLPQIQHDGRWYSPVADLRDGLTDPVDTGTIYPDQPRRGEILYVGSRGQEVVYRPAAHDPSREGCY